MKGLRLSKRNLREYLEANPNKQHTCANESMCVLADFYASVGRVPRGTTKVMVMPDVDLEGEYAEGDVSFYDVLGRRVGGYSLPKWANELAVRFDDLAKPDPAPSSYWARPKATRVTSKSILKKLGSLIGA